MSGVGREEGSAHDDIFQKLYGDDNEVYYALAYATAATGQVSCHENRSDHSGQEE